MFKIVGVSGSPVKDSNTHLFLEEAVKPHRDRPDAQFTLFEAGRMNIADCIQCNYCLAKQTKDKICSIDDEMAAIYKAVLEADALILATPVYFGRLSGYISKVIDRLRALHYGRANPGAMRNKIGAGLDVAWFRMGGLETALWSLHMAFVTMEMIPAAPGALGGMGFTSLRGDGTFDPKDRHQVLQDDLGLVMARKTVDRVFELLDLIKGNRRAD
ncbi:MAG: flavodoxin family protein [Pseudomonadota bacterium]